MTATPEQQDSLKSDWEEIKRPDMKDAGAVADDIQTLLAEQEKRMVSPEACLTSITKDASIPAMNTSAKNRPAKTSEPTFISRLPPPLVPSPFPFLDGYNMEPPKDHRLEAEIKHGKLMAELRRVHKGLLMAYHSLRSGIFLLFLISMQILVASYPLSKGGSLTQFKILALFFVATFIVLGILTLMLMNDLSYRVIHINKLRRRVEKSLDKESPSNTMKEAAAKNKFLKLQAEVEGIQWKVWNPVDFLPGRNEWAKPPVSELGIYAAMEMWDEYLQDYVETPGELAY